MEFYPRVKFFTLALLLMILTNITSALQELGQVIHFAKRICRQYFLTSFAAQNSVVVIYSIVLHKLQFLRRHELDIQILWRWGGGRIFENESLLCWVQFLGFKIYPPNCNHRSFHQCRRTKTETEQQYLEITVLSQGGVEFAEWISEQMFVIPRKEFSAQNSEDSAAQK